MRKPINWVSLITGNKYSYFDYTNHGKGDIYRGFIDLPKNEYSYTLEYEVIDKPFLRWYKD